MLTRLHARRSRRGFSLLELMVTMTIMLILLTSIGELYVSQVREMARMRLLSAGQELASMHDMSYASNGLGIGQPTVDALLTGKFGAPAITDTTSTWSNSLMEYTVTRDYTWPRPAYELRLVSGSSAVCYSPPDDPVNPGTRVLMLGTCGANIAKLTPTTYDLPAPVGVGASIDGATVTVSWQPVPAGSGEVLYTLYRCTSTVALCTPTTEVTSTDQTTVQDPNRATGEQYTYAVTAQTPTQVSPLSASASVTASPLAPVVRVARWDADADNVKLVWGPPLNGEGQVTAFKVLRCVGQTCSPTTSDTLTTQTAVLGQQTYTYTDTTTGLGTWYRYAVVAVNAAGTSEPANASYLVLTPPPAPVNVSATVDAGTVTVTWDAAQTATSYLVKRCSGATCTTVGTPTSTLTVDVPPSGSYTYTVAAVNSADTGPASTPASVLVP